MWKQESMIPKTILHDVIATGKYDIYAAPIRWKWSRTSSSIMFTHCGQTGNSYALVGYPCFSTCWNDANFFHRTMQMEKIEFILIQHPWLETTACLPTLSFPSIPSMRKKISGLTIAGTIQLCLPGREGDRTPGRVQDGLGNRG